MHSNVDRLWASWQNMPGFAWRKDPALVYGDETQTVRVDHSHHGTPMWEEGIQTPMEPWADLAATSSLYDEYVR